jgi:cytoskeletal protein CcmA (bactofilin family)
MPPVTGNLKTNKLTLQQKGPLNTGDLVMEVADNQFIMSMGSNLLMTVSPDGVYDINEVSTHTNTVLTIARDTVIEGSLTVNSNLDVLSDATIEGSLTVNSNLDVLSDATIEGSLTVNSNLDVLSDATIDGSLIVNNNLDIVNNLSVGGEIAGNVTGNVTAADFNITDLNNYEANYKPGDIISFKYKTSATASELKLAANVVAVLNNQPINSYGNPGKFTKNSTISLDAYELIYWGRNEITSSTIRMSATVFIPSTISSSTILSYANMGPKLYFQNNTVWAEVVTLKENIEPINKRPIGIHKSDKPKPNHLSHLKNQKH